MRIPNKDTPLFIPGTTELTPEWFRWFQWLYAAVEPIPQPTPPAPPPPFLANIQFQDEQVDLGQANPRYVSLNGAGVTGAYDAVANRVDYAIPGASGGSPFAFPDGGHQVFELLPTMNGGAAGNLNITSPIGTHGVFRATAVTSPLTRLIRSGSEATLAGGGCSFNSINPLFFSGSATGGGFYMQAVVNTFTTFAGDSSAFFGMASSTSFASFDPSSNNIDQVCLGADSTDTNWQVIHRRTGSAAVKIDLGLAKAANQLFYLTIDGRVPGAFTITVQHVTGFGALTTLISQDLIASIPADNSALAVVFLVRSATTVAGYDTSYIRVVSLADPEFQ